MKSKWLLTVLVALAGLAVYAENVLATPPTLFTGTTIASMVIVTKGTVTGYKGDDPSGTPHVYSATGTNSFVDIGGGVVHIARNEGTEEARKIAVQFVPAGDARQIDVPAPR